MANRMQVILGQTAAHAAKPAHRQKPALRRVAPALLMAGALCAAIAMVYWSSSNGLRSGTPSPAPVPAKEAPHPWWNDPHLGVDSSGNAELESKALATPPRPASSPVPSVIASSAEDDKRLFRLDENGQIKTDGQMRDGIERMVALSDPADLSQKLDAAVQDLPPEQAAIARDLVGRYQAYQEAQNSAYAPGKEHLVPEEALAELDGLKAMRSSYFGEATAAQMFGEEEKVSRRLLELMRDDPVPDAPLWEKAVRAQARYDHESGSGRGATDDIDGLGRSSEAVSSPLTR